ncbi:MAG TPA: ABC transporter ATP-binding protein [Polyangia bacterium]
MDVVVTATDLTVGRGPAPILTHVHLAIARGERVALVGSNGCGKTTLLRVFAGLDRPRAGSIHWLGSPLPSRTARPSVVGVLLQSSPSGPFSVRDLVTLGLGLERPPNFEEKVRVAAVIERFALSDLAARPVALLSGGEAQRALLARALVANPALLILDEPTNHLDPAGRAHLLVCLDDLRADVGVLLATHDLDCAAAADRVALLGDGQLLAIGPADQVLTTALLHRALGVAVRHQPDPRGGRPFLRVEGIT